MQNFQLLRSRALLWQEYYYRPDYVGYRDLFLRRTELKRLRYQSVIVKYYSFYLARRLQMPLIGWLI